jgi:hypothetical protein
MWGDQRIAKSDYISIYVNKCLSEKFIQNWNNNVMNSAKCLNYRIYKSNFCFEQYLSVLPSDLRMYLCNFRCHSIYPLKLADSLILIDLKDIVISVMLTNLVMSFITYSNVLFSTMLELICS